MLEGETKMMRILGRVWIPVLALVVVSVGVIAVRNVRSVFGAHPVIITPKGSDTAADFNPKMVTYEVLGPSGTAVINYLDLDGDPQRTGDVALPWSLTLSTTSASVSPNILAQGDGTSISCRITVDGVVKDQRTTTGVNAETFCLVKSA